MATDSVSERATRNFTAPPQEVESTPKEKEQFMGIYRLSASVPLVAFRYFNKIMRLPLRLSCLLPWKRSALGSAILAFSCVAGQAAVNVSLSTSAPASLQDDFIRNATAQYTGTLTKPFFSSTHFFEITGKKVVTPPPVAIPCTLDDSIKEIVKTSTRSYEYGFANGMDTERYADTQLIYGLQAKEAFGKTCGGLPLSVLISSQTVSMACHQAYNNAVSTISQRWQYIYSPTGLRVDQ